MTAAILFTIDGPPVGKGRPRATKRGGFVSMYTPKPTADYERRIAAAARLAMLEREPLETPVRLNVMVYHPIPASWSKAKQREAMFGRVIPGLPDLDNVVKAVSDAINTIVYKDDRQVVRLSAAKAYSHQPRVEVEVKELLP